MMKKYKKILYVFYALAIIALVFSAGVYLGFSKRPEIEKVVGLSNKEDQLASTVDFSPFWKAWNILKEKSIYTEEIENQDLVWGSIEGLASSFNDPYTVFFPPEDNKIFKDTIHGSFGGIGAEIGLKEKILTVISPIKDSPADKAGLQPGDKIIKIGDIDATSMSIDRAINLIRGEKGTPVKLTVFRDGEKKARDIEIVRDTISMPTIETKKIDEDIFMITFFSFSEKSDVLFYNAIKEFRDSGATKLIIDLRGNSGGYLEIAVNIASWFLEEGQTIVREDYGKDKKERVHRSHGPKLFTDKLKLVVLVNGGSASASEILAGALQENKVATLVGTKTFGKGSVQELVPVTKDTSIKVTIAKWLTPNGVSLSDGGLTPDVKVLLTAKDFEEKKDPQLDKAIEILRSK